MDAQKGSYPSICFDKQIAFEFMLFLTYVPSSRQQKIAVVMMIQSLSRCLFAQLKPQFLILWLWSLHQKDFGVWAKKLM